MKTKTVKYEKIEIPIGDGKSPYMPQKASKFVDHGNIMKTLAIAVRDNLAVLLIGESGTGKTSAIRFLANQTKNGLRRVNLNGGTTADELVGRLLINDKGTYWVDGILTEAMRSGDWIVLDEINAALPEVLFVLQSIMDDDGYLVLNEKDDKEIVHRHKNFRIFATCNPPEYAGTKEMNKALLSRFAICINAEFPPANKELEIIENHLGNAIAKSEMAIKLVGLANETRTAKEQGNSDYVINTRDILNTLRLTEFMNPMEALGLAFSNKLETADNKALKIIAKLHLPLTKTKAKATRKAIKIANDLKLDGNYIIDADLQNTYLGLTKDDDVFKEMIEKDLGTIITDYGTNRENAVKGDEIKIEATYYENAENGAIKNNSETLGDRIASAVKIVNGPNKGKNAIILHHKDLDNSIEIIKNLFEIS
ncbi:AAA family ATPase [Candidatus Woesearchaeota archaeon]|nr:AAA family ATPase [Candidatus Woesearchaeota archaeon]